MRFTDDDLNRLKECCASPDDFMFSVRNIEILALLIRLEAAENCIDDHRGDCLYDIHGNCSCGYEDKIKAWRKACGR